MALFVTCLALRALLAAAPALVIKEIIDRALPDRDLGLLLTMCVLLLAIQVGGSLVSFVNTWLAARLGFEIVADLQLLLVQRLQEMPWSFFVYSRVGAISSRLTTDVNNSQQLFTGPLSNVVNYVVQVIAVIGVMFAINAQVTLLLLACVPLIWIPARYVGARLRSLGNLTQDKYASLSAEIVEQFSPAGALHTKLFGAQQMHQGRIAEIVSEIRATSLRRQVLRRFYFMCLGTLGGIGLTGIYYFGGLLVVHQQASIGALVGLALVFQRAYGPLSSLTNWDVSVSNGVVAFQRVFEVLDSPIREESNGGRRLDGIRGLVEFQNVSFSYPKPASVIVPSLAQSADQLGGEPAVVLRRISFTLKPGTITALVGVSGAGKSTIASLVARLYSCTAGTVCLDGIDIRDLSEDVVIKAVGVMTQDVHVFHDTVARNLRLANASATLDQLEQACEKVGFSEVVSRMPDGYDTLVGERGYRLSGGERQRLAAARILLRDPRVVILDEATSHLDQQSERDVHGALVNSLSDRSILVIAHRLSTIRHADAIHVLDGGEIVESGTHDELMARDGRYASQYRSFLGDEVGQRAAVTT